MDAGDINYLQGLVLCFWDKKHNPKAGEPTKGGKEDVRSEFDFFEHGRRCPSNDEVHHPILCSMSEKEIMHRQLTFTYRRCRDGHGLRSDGGWEDLRG